MDRHPDTVLDTVYFPCVDQVEDVTCPKCEGKGTVIREETGDVVICPNLCNGRPLQQVRYNVHSGRRGATWPNGRTEVTDTNGTVWTPLTVYETEAEARAAAESGSSRLWPRYL